VSSRSKEPDRRASQEPGGEAPLGNGEDVIEGEVLPAARPNQGEPPATLPKGARPPTVRGSYVEQSPWSRDPRTRLLVMLLAVLLLTTVVAGLVALRPLFGRATALVTLPFTPTTTSPRTTSPTPNPSPTQAPQPTPSPSSSAPLPSPSSSGGTVVAPYACGADFFGGIPPQDVVQLVIGNRAQLGPITDYRSSNTFGVQLLDSSDKVVGTIRIFVDGPGRVFTVQQGFDSACKPMSSLGIASPSAGWDNAVHLQFAETAVQLTVTAGGGLLFIVSQ
jgi:hypothetical protein